VGSNGYLRGGSNGGNVLGTSGTNVTLAGGGAKDALADTGSGSNLLLAGPGNTTLTAGAGGDTMVGGSGADLFVLTRAAVAHSEVIQGFTTGTDHLRFSGFGSTTPIASQTVVGGNLQLVLADNAQVTFVGVTSLGSGFLA
jgi:Ca2+-binding RTX toxin-like protein